MVKPCWLSKNYQTPSCLLFVEKQAALKLLLVKKLNNAMNVGFSQFMLEQTTHYKYFTPNNHVITTTITPFLDPSFNQILINKFISTLIINLYSLDSLTSVFYTDSSVDISQAKVGIA